MIRRLFAIAGTVGLAICAFGIDGYHAAAQAPQTPRPCRATPATPASTTGTAAKASATIADVAWIGGTWIGTAGPVTVEERWTPSAGGAMLGIGRTLRGGAMTAFEFLCISERDGGLVYTALPNARTPATDFTLTSFTADSVTFENPAHDFPKLIRYSRKPDGTLETTVSGGGSARGESFILKRQ